VHAMSPRARQRFLAVNCGAVAPNVIESELFGHERGSYTGADRSRKGYFQEADGGTLLLDEIAEMPADLQVKLLRVIETQHLFRVGTSEPTRIDVRVIAATNRDPVKAIRDGHLREDLYYRLNVFQVVLPPLRARGDDVLMLAEHFLAEINAREGTNKRWSERALRRLKSHSWPGNVRELSNLVERLAVLSADVIDDPGLPESTEAAVTPANSRVVLPVGSPLAEVEKTMILATLRVLEDDKHEAARRLGISIKTLYNRLNVYQATPPAKISDSAAS